MSDSSFWSTKRVLVGGGCGLLGSYLVPQIVETGAQVTVVDNLDNGYVDILDPVKDRIKMVQADLRDPAVCLSVAEDQDVILNLAAKASGMDYSRAHSGEMLVYNLLCTITLLEAARLRGVERFLIVSSSCVYPDDSVVPTPELPVFTGTPEMVNEGYGWAKRIQELAGTYYANDYGMKITIIRPFNLYGGNYRWANNNKAHVVPALVKRIMDGEDPLRVWGSGRQGRNLLHGSDAAPLIMKVIEKDLGPIPVNIGYDDCTTVIDLVNLICEISGKHPRIEFDTSKPEGCFRKSADATRLRETTDGFVPRVNLRDGIAEMLEWYKRSF